jgi:hypothetical protein
MAVNAILIPSKDIPKTFGYLLRPSNPAIEAFLRHIGLQISIHRLSTGAFFDSPLNSPVGHLYSTHCADGTVAHAVSADAVNVINEVDLNDTNIRNTFAGEYAKKLGLPEWNSRQIERNETWSDVANFIATLFNMTSYFNAFRTAFNAHCATHAAYTTLGVADNTNQITGAAVTIPTPDGKTPSIKYRDGFSKYLVEIEGTEPAFIKAKVGTWLKDATVLAKESFERWNAHVRDPLIHDTPVTTLVLPPEKLIKSI